MVLSVYLLSNVWFGPAGPNQTFDNKKEDEYRSAEGCNGIQSATILCHSKGAHDANPAGKISNLRWLRARDHRADSAFQRAAPGCRLRAKPRRPRGDLRRDGRARRRDRWPLRRDADADR